MRRCDKRTSHSERATSATTGAIRVISETAALKLQVAIRAVVECGTAKSVAPIRADTGWQIGSKDWLWSCDGTFEWHAKAAVNF